MALAVASIVGLVACHDGSTRSVSAYCKTFFEYGKQLRAEYQGAQNSDLLTQAAKAIEAPQELATFFSRLDKVAPSDIEPDIAVIRNAFQKESDNLGPAAANPLAGLITNLLTGLTSTGSWQRVNDWTDEHC